MQGPVSEHCSHPQLSARASIALWLVLAGIVWGTLGLAIIYAMQGGDDSVRPQADQPSKVVPAAGGGEKAPRRNGR